jgi:hypothetical protein
MCIVAALREGKTVLICPSGAALVRQFHALARYLARAAALDDLLLKADWLQATQTCHPEPRIGMPKPAIPRPGHFAIAQARATVNPCPDNASRPK